jgi:hypothetical protein
MTLLTDCLGPQSSRTFEFPHPQDRSSWESQLHGHIPLSAGHEFADEHPHGHWKESPITPGYSPFTTGPAPLMHHQTRDGSSHGPPFGVSRHEPTWPIPTRSMSFGHLDDLSQQYSNNYHPQYQFDARRRASEMHPPSLHTSANSSNASMSDAPGPPMSAPLTSSGMHQYSIPPAWTSHPAQSPVIKIPDFGGWYASETGQLAKVQEEEIGPHFAGEPPMLYSSAGHH